MGKISKVLFIVALISIAMCSCTKEEIVLEGNHVTPVGETRIEIADLSAGLVYGYLKNQDSVSFLAEFIVPDTLISGIAEAMAAEKEVIIRYQSIDQSYVEDDSGFFSEEHDLVLADDNLEVSNVDVVE